MYIQRKFVKNYLTSSVDVRYTFSGRSKSPRRQSVNGGHSFNQGGGPSGVECCPQSTTRLINEPTSGRDGDYFFSFLASTNPLILWLRSAYFLPSPRWGTNCGSIAGGNEEKFTGIVNIFCLFAEVPLNVINDVAKSMSPFTLVGGIKIKRFFPRG